MARIIVAHEVPFDNTLERFCVYAGDFYGNQECHYLKRRNRTFGRKRPPEVTPKCLLFETWLEENGVYSLKCEQCYRLAREAACGKEASNERK